MTSQFTHMSFTHAATLIRSVDGIFTVYWFTDAKCTDWVHQIGLRSGQIRSGNKKKFISKLSDSTLNRGCELCACPWCQINKRRGKDVFPIGVVAHAYGQEHILLGSLYAIWWYSLRRRCCGSNTAAFFSCSSHPYFIFGFYDIFGCALAH